MAEANLHAAASEPAQPSRGAAQNRSHKRGRGRGRGSGRGKGTDRRKPPQSTDTPSSHQAEIQTAISQMTLSEPSSVAQSNTTSSTSNGKSHRKPRARSNRTKSSASTQSSASHDTHPISENAAKNAISTNKIQKKKIEKGPSTAKASRRSFGAKLTEASAEATPFVPRLVGEHTDLRARLVAELSQEDYDCTICYNTITQKQAVWSCTRCYAVLHLGCIRKWAEKSVQQIEERNALHEDPEIRNTKGQWRCPGCQFARSSIPTTYRCWCSRVTNPRPHSLPHSCGASCARGCASHGCMAGICHPGPCPPCAATVLVSCYCGKQSNMNLRCSQLAADPHTRDSHPKQGMASCGAICGKELSCAHHTCTQPCHQGACPPCTEQLPEADCHCGRHTQTMACKDRDMESRSASVKSAWSCGEKCDRWFACHKHRCQRPCHVRSDTDPICPRDPSVIHTCFCGRTAAGNREQCTDAIPSCGALCGEKLACGHTCQETCHAKPCPPCKQPITQVCRCGNSKRSILCKDASQSQEYLCPTTCKAQRHCGKHQCGTQCCPLSYQATLSKKQAGLPPHTDLHHYFQQLDPAGIHACPLPCGRVLSCGKHTCESRCHRGACAPCLRSTFTEVACSCGRTVLEPPVPCGTRVNCSYPCQRPDPPCGHAKVPHTCHPPEIACPPCVHLTSRKCVCGARVIPAVPCSRAVVRCGTPCQAMLACGMHKCPGACHDVPAECPECTQTCGKPRSRCGHPCQKICHAPDPCPEEEPCTAVLVRRCVCGHNEKMEVCGMSTETPRRDALAPLDCTPQCKVAQRNAQFASALGLTSAPNASNLYDAPLFRYAATERRSAQAVQDVLADFVQSPRTSAQLRPMLQQLAVRNNTEPVRVSIALLDFAARLAKIYHIDTEPCTEQGALRIGPLTHARGADLRIRRVRGACVPCPTLLDFMASNPSLVKRSLASPAGSPRPAWNSSRTSSPLPGQQKPSANAIMLLDLPEQILNDPPSLAPILLPATRHQQRRWEVHRLDNALILSDIHMEPQSAAVVAAASQIPARASLSASERRLANLMDEVLAAWTATDSVPIRAQLITYDASQGKILCVVPNESDS